MQTVLFVIYTLFLILVAARVLLRPHRQPASRIAWIVVILSLPLLGVIAYLLVGETNLGRRRLRKRVKVISQLQKTLALKDSAEEELSPDISKEYDQIFLTGKTTNGFNPAGGNRAALMADSNQAIDSVVADIDAATDHVHLIYYIWLPDNNGRKVVDALIRAASRGVSCRALVDCLGSRLLIKSKHWQSMLKAGVRLAEALPIKGSPIFYPLKGRLDLRNHRKIVVIDNRITYCGSQNCADPEFRVKPKYAPWVDLMIRFEGPVAKQNQYLFASDWMLETGENLNKIFQQHVSFDRGGFIAQVVGTGPDEPYSAMPEVFKTFMYAARHSLVVTTPYYVPDESMQAGMCAAARRGVETTLILPAKNDSWLVHATSRSYYSELISAGVKINEYEGGLLHTKSLTVDDQVALVGSANMDRRSFELNYENNILFQDEALTKEVRQRQEEYLQSSRPVTMDMVDQWHWGQHLIYNSVAMMSPLL